MDISSSYCVYLKGCVEFSRNNFKELYNEDEHELLLKTLRLSDKSIELLSRITLRKHVWIKSISLKSYIYNNSSIEVVVGCLQELKSTNIVEFVDGSTSFKSVWEAIVACLSTDELANLDRILTNNKTKVVGKLNTLNHLYNAITTQKTVFGAPLSERVAKITCDYLKKVAEVPQLCMIVRVVPVVLQLLRRCQRLYQISSSIPSTYSPTATGTISMSQPIDYNAPLLVAFHKVRFPQYRTKQQQTVLFRIRRDFHQWEAATEMRFTVEMIGQQALATAFNKFRHAALLVSIHCNMEKAVRQFDNDSFSSTMLKTGSTDMTSALSGLLPRASQLLGDISALQCECAAVDRGMASMSTAIRLLAALSLVSHSVEAQQQNAHCHQSREDYWIKFDAGTQLAYLCYDSAAHFEKEVNRDYFFALSLYELLLTLPFLPHRRGVWYKRVSMDLEHLKRPRAALRAAFRGVLDPLVLISDRTELLVRIKALTGRLERAAAKVKGGSSGAVDFCVHSDFSVAGNKQQEDDLRLLCSAHCSTQLVHSFVVREAVAKLAGLSTPNDVCSTAVETQKQSLISRSQSERTITNNASSVELTGRSSTVPGDCTWSCAVCTFINVRLSHLSDLLSASGDNDTCEVCTSPRAPTSSSPLSSLPAPLSARGVGSIERGRGDSQCTAIDLMSSSDEENEVDEVVVVTRLCKREENAKEEQLPLANLNCHTIVEQHRALYSRAVSEAQPKTKEGCGAATVDLLTALDLGHMEAPTADALEVLAQRHLIALGLTPPPEEDKLSTVSVDFSSSHAMQHYVDHMVAAASLDGFSAPETFTVQGRRCGDPSRKGKSRFCGEDGEFVSVEGFVMQKCRFVHPDDQLHQHMDEDFGGIDGAPCGDGVLDLSEAMDTSESEMFIASHSSGDVQFSHLSYCDAGDDGSSRDFDYLQPQQQRLSSTAVSAASSPVGRKTLGNAASAKVVGKQKGRKTAGSKSEARTTSTANIDLSDYLRVVDGGGWQGWHCEGSPLKSLFGLLLWDILFGEHPSAVFVTPYQDCPLDLGYPSFIASRQEAVLRRLGEIAAFTAEDILHSVGSAYRAHYRQVCRGVSWGYSLATLQLVALCMGAAGLHTVCRACAVDYKQFSGGAPDLLLLRVSKETPAAPTTRGDVASCSSETNIDRCRQREFVELGSLLGPGWAQLDAARAGDGANEDLRSLQNSAAGTASSGNKMQKSERDSRDGGSAGKRPLSLSGVKLGGGGSSGKKPRDAESTTESTSSSCSTAEGVAGGDDGSLEARALWAVSDEEEDEVAPSLQLPEVLTEEMGSAPVDAYEYQGPDLDLSSLYSADIAGQSPCAGGAETPESSLSQSLSLSHLLRAVSFEVLFVEVKGPGDVLAYRQLLWLHLLNSGSGNCNNSSNNKSAGGMRAVLGHVKE